jgi:hypothetical protein
LERVTEAWIGIGDGSEVPQMEHVSQMLEAPDLVSGV